MDAREVAAGGTDDNGGNAEFVVFPKEAATGGLANGTVQTGDSADMKVCANELMFEVTGIGAVVLSENTPPVEFVIGNIGDGLATEDVRASEPLGNEVDEITENTVDCNEDAVVDNIVVLKLADDFDSREEALVTVRVIDSIDIVVVAGDVVGETFAGTEEVDGASVDGATAEELVSTREVVGITRVVSVEEVVD